MARRKKDDTTYRYRPDAPGRFKSGNDGRRHPGLRLQTYLGPKTKGLYNGVVDRDAG
jgi:hypothetical protein